MQQQFPEMQTDDADESVLLSTIRVTKKLLSLTNRLPKPAYDAREEDKRSRHTTVGAYLPMIGKKSKNSNLNLNVKDNQSYKKLFAANSKRSGINISRITPSIKQLQPLKTEETNQSSNNRGTKKSDESERRSDIKRLMVVPSNREDPSPDKDYSLGILVDYRDRLCGK
eukprot:TRINITY_DN7949_c0_g1_i16.p2 TRINITY_DN7949_c0_g1~~TRINITY_DN7949_c0_g1_i16.p2  ORF type:complete len:169 (-),score=56.91 TRINITY_DN7949_c0_g1_i16:784-1290(-)